MKYTKVYQFAYNVLKLNPNEAQIFSFISGFKSKGFYGSIDFLSSEYNLNRSTIIRILQSLIDKSYIIKRKDGKNIFYFQNFNFVKDMLNLVVLVEEKEDDLGFNDDDLDTFYSSKKELDSSKLELYSSKKELDSSINSSKLELSQFQKETPTVPKRNSDSSKLEHNKTNYNTTYKTTTTSITEKPEEEDELKKSKTQNSNISVPPFLKGKGYFKFIYTDFDWDRDWKDVEKIKNFLRPQFGQDVKIMPIEMEINEQKQNKTFRFAKSFFIELIHQNLKFGAVPQNGKMETL